VANYVSDGKAQEPPLERVTVKLPLNGYSDSAPSMNRDADRSQAEVNICLCFVPIKLVGRSDNGTYEICDDGDEDNA
jgi:hypothetical protein